MTSLLSSLLTVFVALEHLGFLALEMFLWDKPAGRRVFRLSPELARETRVLAANQGLYNGFLAAGLVWSLLSENAGVRAEARVFFLACVIAAGFFGAATVNKRILFVQALPGVAALVVTLAAHGG